MSTLTLKRSPSPFPSPSSSKRSCAGHPPSSANVRFLIFSDTHGNELPTSLPKCDVLLHCGDMTEDGSPESIEKALHALGKVEAELRLVIAGNHEISMDKDYYLGEGGSATDVERTLDLVHPTSSSVASKKGITFLQEGTHSFTLSSGASFTIYASPFTPRYGASAFQYPTGEDRFNPREFSHSWATNVGTEASTIPESVDIVMTHGPAKYILDSTPDGRSAGCDHLRRALERVQPRLHCFGHVHQGYGAQRLAYDEHVKVEGEADSIKPLPQEWVGKNQARKKGFASIPPASLQDFRSTHQTLCVNAAMQGEKGVLEKAPWIVDLDFLL
ncbi:hypothetical protein ACEQ8H_003694 [Pleosporales sp. CAS-2024a]